MFSAEILTLDEGCAVHAFLDGGVTFVRVDADLIERAEILGAEIVRALRDRTADTRVFAFFHDDTPFKAAAFLPHDGIMRKKHACMHPMHHNIKRKQIRLYCTKRAEKSNCIGFGRNQQDSGGFRRNFS